MCTAGRLKARLAVEELGVFELEDAIVLFGPPLLPSDHDVVMHWRYLCPRVVDVDVSIARLLASFGAYSKETNVPMKELLSRGIHRSSIYENCAMDLDSAQF